MAVVSVRLNREEEKILNYLTDYFHEDIQDIKFIEEHIARKQGREFITGDELFED
jgi:hypothetical protein